MTSQLPDLVRVDATTFDLVGHRGALWRPDAAVLPVVMASTACWRGYVCTYAIAGDRLVLDRVEAMVGRYDDDEHFIAVDPPPLNGRAPRRQPTGGGEMFNTVYDDLALPVRFTGELILGADPLPDAEAAIEALAWTYAHVLRLRCTDGAVAGRDDLSALMAQVRAAGGAHELLANADLAWLWRAR